MSQELDQLEHVLAHNQAVDATIQSMFPVIREMLQDLLETNDKEEQLEIAMAVANCVKLVNDVDKTRKSVHDRDGYDDGSWDS